MKLSAQVAATVGAAVWAGIAVAARAGVVRIGAIELMFLFGPLVVVPLGMELGRMINRSGGLEKWGRRLQPVGAAFAVIAILLPPGKRAGGLALGIMVIAVRNEETAWAEVAV